MGESTNQLNYSSSYRLRLAMPKGHRNSVRFHCLQKFGCPSRRINRHQKIGTDDEMTPLLFIWNHFVFFLLSFLFLFFLLWWCCCCCCCCCLCCCCSCCFWGWGGVVIVVRIAPCLGFSRLKRVSAWWFGCHQWLIFPFILGLCHHPNWRTRIFFGGLAKNHQPDTIFWCFTSNHQIEIYIESNLSVVIKNQQAIHAVSSGHFLGEFHVDRLWGGRTFGRTLAIFFYFEPSQCLMFSITSWCPDANHGAGIFHYIWDIFGVNVGKYCTMEHMGWFGTCFVFLFPLGF